jgi:hypothetical protein
MFKFDSSLAALCVVFAGRAGRRCAGYSRTIGRNPGKASDRLRNMKLIIGIVALIIVVAVFLRLRSRASYAEEAREFASNDTASATVDFHAVSIRPGSDACRAAKSIEGQRFLSGNAPRVPLPDCDASDCNCRFAHHVDRRTGDDRRTPYPSATGPEPGSIGKDQRAEVDRRRRQAQAD